MAIGTASTLALLGGEPVRPKDKLWPAWPMWDDAERNALSGVLESGQWWFGERVREFERAFAEFQGAKYCVSCVNGTVGLELALEAAGVRDGDEVIVPPFTFVATATAVLRLGATPVFADVDETWNINPAAIEAAITHRTTAIVPVHFGGRIADMDAINAIASANDLIVVEDAAHAWGSRWKGKGAGTLGRCGSLSFQASKNMTAGEGGAIVTDDEELAKLCRSLTHSGRKEGEAWYQHYHAATNARLTEFSAAILHAQLGRMDEQTETRERNGAYLDEALSEIEGITPQPGDTRITRRARHIYCLRIDPARFGCRRDRFVEAVNAEGLPIGAGYPIPLYHQPLFRESALAPKYANVHCSMCEDLCFRSAAWFRHSILLGTREDMEDIVRIFQKVRENASRL